MRPLPGLRELRAPAAWARIEFISDLHLRPAEAATVAAWRAYMAACDADALFILGDLFEAWVGDDAAEQPGFAADCAQVLRATAGRLPVFFMRGNRDFLVGERLAAATGLQLLDDPTVLAFGPQRWLLSHGDALCLDDVEYQAFRSQVRAPGWQAAFLARPLAEREAVARGLRERSEARAATASDPGDLDPAETLRWLESAGAAAMIHGHTHRPADHALPGGRRRIVLSDWDAAAHPARAEVLRLGRHGTERIRLA